MTNQLMYVLLQFTWGILQNLAGLVMFLACKMLGCKSKKYKNAVVTKWNNKYGSVSLGMFLFVFGWGAIILLFEKTAKIIEVFVPQPMGDVHDFGVRF